MNNESRGAFKANSGEFDLIGLFRIIWPRRVLIAGIGGCCVVVGIALAYIISPVYETSTTLTAVELNQLDALNRSKIYSLSPEEALRRVGARLSSYTTRLEYFRSRPDLVETYRIKGQSVEHAFESFSTTALGAVYVSFGKSDSLRDFVSLSLRYGKGIDGAAVLNEFVDFAVEREREQLLRDIKVILGNRLVEVDNQLNSALSEYHAGTEWRIAHLEEKDAIKRAELSDELNALRVQLKLKREARLTELEEAISIARRLGLRKPSTPSLMADEVSESGNIIRTEVNAGTVPLYFMGTDVLEAERATLRQRTSDDFVEPRIGEIRKALLLLAKNRGVEAIRARVNDQAFLEGVEALRAERQRLQSLDTQVQSLDLVNVDKRAVFSSRPVKPHKALIVMISLVSGLLLGVIVALVLAAFKSQFRRPQTSEIADPVLPILPVDSFREVDVLLPGAQVKVP